MINLIKYSGVRKILQNIAFSWTAERRQQWDISGFLENFGFLNIVVSPQVNQSWLIGPWFSPKLQVFTNFESIMNGCESRPSGLAVSALFNEETTPVLSDISRYSMHCHPLSFRGPYTFLYSVFATRMLPSSWLASSSVASKMSHMAFDLLVSIFGQIFRFLMSSSLFPWWHQLMSNFLRWWPARRLFLSSRWPKLLVLLETHFLL